MKFYLAARYSRREELCIYRDALVRRGHRVTSTWLEGSHQISDGGDPIGEDGEALVEGDSGSLSPEAAALRQRFAREDLEDIEMSDILIAFTEQPRTGPTRGGRHVELGYALARGITVYVVGPRENLFCWLDDVVHFDDWQACLASIERDYTPV